MIRFDAKRGAGLLLLATGSYLGLSLALGRSARSEAPPDLQASAAEVGLDVWKTAAALLESEKVVVVDSRSSEEFARYHLPGAVNVPDADAARLQSLAKERPMVIVVATKDEAARRTIGEARTRDPNGRYHYLQDGARSWYLAFDLPVAMFSEAAAPRGYDRALDTVKGFFRAPAPEGRAPALEAVQILAKLSYAPTLLQQSGKPKVAKGPKKKITGGCGG